VGGWGRRPQIYYKSHLLCRKGYTSYLVFGTPSKNKEKQQQLTTDDGETMAKYLIGESDDKINNNIIKD